ncbi:MAG: (Fe-S)-binding protein [Promethearchaeota archaeon]
MVINQNENKSPEELGLKYYEGVVHRCFRCGYCKFTYDYIDYNCPSYKKFRFESFSTGGRMWLIHGLMTDEVEWSPRLTQILYACTTCGNCIENCRMYHIDDIFVDVIEMARALAYDKGYCSKEAMRFGSQILREHNPYEKHEDRLSWLPEDFKNPEGAEIGYFVGCTSSYREKQLARNTFDVLTKLGIKFVIFREEWCCGSPLLRTGQREIALTQARHNIEFYKNNGIKTVLTSCAGCFRTIKVDYPKILGNELQDGKLPFEVVHTSEFIKQLLDEGKIQFKSEFNKKVTYHDPCHLGRHSGVYDEPRDVINQIPGMKLIEMRKIRGNATCCGAGGGVKAGFSDWALEMASERIEEALETGAEVLVTTCPFCEHNFSDAIKKNKSNIEVMDLVDVLKDVL